MRHNFRPAPLSLGLMAALMSTAAMADVPRVATDIAPVHALVAQVMGDLGEPALIVRPGASPHGYSMRPSEAAALNDADLVVWVGDALSPWLEGPLETLAGKAAQIELLEVPGTVLMDYREGATFAAHDHGDHGHDHKEGHAGHDHGHDHKEDHAGHDHDHAHDHSGTDSHAWLDPVNGQLWLGAIAAELARLDPDNAATYAANAAAGQAELVALEAELAARMAPLAGTGFVVFHDAYQYFEQRFGLQAAGAISLSDASAPSAARIAELQKAVRDLNVACIFSEPQFDAGLIETVFEGQARIGVLDPLGQDLTPGAGLYAAMLRQMGDAFETCLKG
jgi:zinc transport system substrate-binding protein